MPAPSPVPGVVGGAPMRTPARRPLMVEQGGSGGRVGDYVARRIEGICIAFDSPALTDRPLWIRVDDPGSV